MSLCLLRNVSRFFYFFCLFFLPRDSNFLAQAVLDTGDEFSPSFWSIIKASPLIPFIEAHLRNDSIYDMVRKFSPNSEINSQIRFDTLICT